MGQLLTHASRRARGIFSKTDRRWPDRSLLFIFPSVARGGGRWMGTSNRCVENGPLRRLEEYTLDLLLFGDVSM